MNVLYDDQIFRLQRRGGISRYFVELIQAFRAAPDKVSCRYPGVWSDNQHVVEAGLARRIPEPPIPGFIPKGREAVRRLNQAIFLGNPSKSRNAKTLTNIYHPTYYLQASFVETAAPLIVTAHDMIPERLPELFARNPHKEKAWYLRQASGVIAISQSTADDIHELMPGLSAPIRVIPHGVDLSRFSVGSEHSRKGEKRGSASPVVLFVGSRVAYKDFDVLLRAVVHPRLQEVSILAAGPPGPTRAEQEFLSGLGILNRVRFVTPTDEELPSLYQRADVFVFPSRYEGFGLPTLEAMACGTPVILAQSSSHPEVGGDAAAYFCPGDSEELAIQIESVLSDTARHNRMRNAGQLRAKSFTWQATADQTLGFYREIIG